MDEVDRASFLFTVQRTPLKIAGIMKDKGHKILYLPNQNQTEALYIPNGFPYTNIWLDIHGRIFRGMNHYTISNAGCEFIYGIIRNEYLKMPENFTCKRVTENKTARFEIEATTEEYTTYIYHAKPGETVLDISEKLHVNAYAILENNESVSSYTDDCSGMKLQVPTHYGSLVKLHIDATHGLPTLIEVHDPKGLVQRYQYTDYQINPSIPKDFFTESYLEGLE